MYYVEKEEQLLCLGEDTPAYGSAPQQRAPLKIGRYVDLRSDFGMKHIFGRPSCSLRLQSMLQAFLDGHREVGELTYVNTEVLGATAKKRRAIFDILTKDQSEKNYLVEMQKKFQTYYISRSNFYLYTFIANLAVKGDWDFNFEATTMISFLNFTLREDDPDYIHVSMDSFLKDHKPVNDSLMKVFVETEKF